MRVFASTSVEAGDDIDPGALDRLAKMAAWGAGTLRVKLAESESADAEDDRPVEPVAP